MTLYVPAHFRMEDRAALVDFMRQNAFATVVSASGPGISASHLPLLVDVVGDKVLLRGHFARANTHWESVDGKDALAIFTGPHAYISPTWYVTHPSVPTWNYTAAHATGKVRLTDEAELHEIVSELSAKYEAGNNPPWRLSEQPAPYVSSMLGAIVGFEMEVARLEGKFKLSQNRPVEIPGVTAKLDALGEKALAKLMREHAPAPKG
jgi:transcriptional regulator